MIGDDSIGAGSSGDAPPAGPAADNVYAAIDLGTNNCRMLIARPERGGGERGFSQPEQFRVIDSYSRITRLGEGLAGSGLLGRGAMDRTVEALKRCVDKMQRRGVTHARNVATEACRRAANCDHFLDRVRAEAGLELEIISADEEARLALAGCSALLEEDRPRALVFDIGGGSTELLWVRLNESGIDQVEGFATLPLGVVTVSEDCGGGDLTRRLYEAVTEHVVNLLAPFESAHRIGEAIARGEVQMLGTSGTVTTLGGIALDLPRYNRFRVDGLRLDFDSIFTISHRLSLMSHAARAAIPCIGRQRADLVLAGCAILEAICTVWPVGSLRIADRGVREGLLLELMARDRSRAEGAAA